MVTRHALALVVAAAAIAACDDSGAVAAPAPTGVATWRPQAILPFDAPRFEAAARARGVVVGDETEWVELPDGWMPVDASDASPHYGLVAAPGGLVAWQAGGHPQTSDIGLVWQDALTGPDEANVSAIVATGDRLVMLGDGVKERIGAWASADGTTWSTLDAAPLGMSAGTAFGSGLLAVGSSGTDAAAWFTSDGTRWQAHPPAAGALPSEMTGVAAASGTAVAIGNSGETAVAWRSEDLGSWTSSAIPASDDMSIRTVGHAHGMFAIAGQRNHQPTLWQSQDGRLWSPTVLPMAPATNGVAAVIREIGARIVVFGYVIQDAGNGGDWPVAHLVWTLEPPG